MGDIQSHPISSNNWRTSLVPAPAVIPAPRAYINAVAVKGFVVELGMCKESVQSHPPDRRPPLLPSVNFDTNIVGLFPSYAFNAREGARGFTVTKKARPKQSYDLNLKAWDNKVAAYGLPFRLLLVLKICGRLWIRMTSTWFRPRASGVWVIQFRRRLALSRNEGGLFGGERTWA